jgi:uncharacterized protein (DUF433 family)
MGEAEGGGWTTIPCRQAVAIMISSDLKAVTNRGPAVVPAYSVAEAAHHLKLPRTTVRAWLVGRIYPTEGGSRRFTPVVLIADPASKLLSFRDLVEIHVLSAIRRDHRIRLPAIRKAITYLRKTFHSQHPLSDQQMLTDGKDLFIERYGNLVNVSQHGQLEMKQVLEAYLRRIERDRVGLPIRLFPFTRDQIETAPRTVVIDPAVQFGRPCLTGTGIPTAILFERYNAGDSIRLLADDYRRSPDEIEEAIRYETRAA